MGYDVTLELDGEAVRVPPHQEGGTVAVGGTTEAWMSITYNFSDFYRRELDAEQGLRWLDGRQAEECIPRLQDAVDALGTDATDRYWDVHPGNAGGDLEGLLRWARQYPEATFKVA